VIGPVIYSVYISLKWWIGGRSWNDFIHHQQSSTYLYNGVLMCKSFIITRKKRGPSFVPCGTPAFICRHDDLFWPSLKRRYRSCRNSAQKFNKIGRMLSCCNLWSKILWSMRSKAFEKSIIQHLRVEPGFSNSASQLWIMWIRACVVEQFLYFQTGAGLLMVWYN
jgi:hypothetical protein